MGNSAAIVLGGGLDAVEVKRHLMCFMPNEALMSLKKMQSS
jgi:hypothetical protein